MSDLTSAVCYPTCKVWCRPDEHDQQYCAAEAVLDANAASWAGPSGETAPPDSCLNCGKTREEHDQTADELWCYQFTKELQGPECLSVFTSKVSGFDYPAAARSIALNLAAVCDETLPYPEMIANAARNAASRLSVLEAREGQHKALFDAAELVVDAATDIPLGSRAFADYLTDLRRVVRASREGQHDSTRREWWCEPCGEFVPVTVRADEYVCSKRHIVASWRASPSTENEK